MATVHPLMAPNNLLLLSLLQGTLAEATQHPPSPCPCRQAPTLRRHHRTSSTLRKLHLIELADTAMLYSSSEPMQGPKANSTNQLRGSTALLGDTVRPHAAAALVCW
jgi:hypothetical protein